MRKFHFGGDFNDGHADQSERVDTYEYLNVHLFKEYIQLG